MTQYDEDKRTTFQLALTQILNCEALPPSPALDAESSKNEISSTMAPTKTPNDETTDEDLLNVSYTYDIDISKKVIHIYDINSALTSSHHYHDHNIQVTDNLALELINVIKRNQKKNEQQ